MGTTKKDLVRLIERLPEDVSVEQVMAELYARIKIERGLQQLDEGKGIPHQHVKERLKKWQR